MERMDHEASRLPIRTRGVRIMRPAQSPESTLIMLDNVIRAYLIGERLVSNAMIKANARKTPYDEQAEDG